jgi:PKD repeat protein
LPIEYAWQASGQDAVTHTGGLSDTLAYTWDSPGTQLITVTADNIGGSVVATHTITISDVPIDGLFASSDSPTLLGESTAFTATVEAGTNVSYAWDFGDESQGEGATAAHTYAAVGVYTATVTATNGLGSAVAEVGVTILPPPTCAATPDNGNTDRIH